MTVLAWAGPILALTKEERLILWVGVLAGVLVLGGVFIGRIDRWRKRQMEEADETPTQMTSFRDMYENGELSKEEYDRVLRRVAERVGARPRTAPAAEPPATEDPPPTPPA